MPAFRSCAVIPAAGRSRRMGFPKLLAEVDRLPLIDHVLDAWRASAVDEIVVVLRVEQVELAARCRSNGVQVLATNTSPRTMRDTLELGLSYIEERFAPQANDVWLVAPADMPGLTATAIDQLLAKYDPSSPSVIVPQVGGRRAHPVLLPWSSVAALRKLPREFGLNTLVRQCGAETIDLADDGLLADLDTPGDFSAWLGTNHDARTLVAAAPRNNP